MEKAEILYPSTFKGLNFGVEYQENDKKRTFVLKKMADIPIERYIKVKKDANPFDTDWDAYFEKRCKKKHRVRTA